MVDFKHTKWKETIKTKMPSMCDNQVCDLIDLKHDCEIVRYK